MHEIGDPKQDFVVAWDRHIRTKRKLGQRMALAGNLVIISTKLRGRRLVKICSSHPLKNYTKFFIIQKSIFLGTKDKLENEYKCEICIHAQITPNPDPTKGSSKFETRELFHFYSVNAVTQGNESFAQVHGIGYGEEALAPVIRYENVRTLIAASAAWNCKLTQFEVTFALVHTTLHENVYLEQLKGGKVDGNLVCVS